MLNRVMRNYFESQRQIYRIKYEIFDKVLLFSVVISFNMTSSNNVYSSHYELTSIEQILNNTMINLTSSRPFK